MQERKQPFPTFVLWMLVFLVSLLVLLLRGCGPLFVKGPPNPAIQAEGQNLSWVMAKVAWNGENFPSEDLFLRYGQRLATPSQAAAGEMVSITIDGTLPDEATLREYALNPDETSAFGSAQPLDTMPIYFGSKTASFSLPEPEDHPIRGYVLTCSWEENTCEYAFVIQILDE